MWVHNGCFYVFRDWWGTPKPLISSWKMLELIFDANLIVYQTNLIIFLLEMPYDGHKHQIFRYQTHLKSIFWDSPYPPPRRSPLRQFPWEGPRQTPRCLGQSPQSATSPVDGEFLGRKFTFFDVFCRGKAAILQHVGRHHIQMLCSKVNWCFFWTTWFVFRRIHIVFGKTTGQSCLL